MPNFIELTTHYHGKLQINIDAITAFGHDDLPERCRLWLGTDKYFVVLGVSPEQLQHHLESLNVSRPQTKR